MDVNLALSFDFNRVVYPNDVNIGVRQLQLTKGSSYNFVFTCISGGNTVTPPVSGVTFAVSESDKKSTPFISLSGVAPSGFNMSAASPVLDYILNGKDTLAAETDISLINNGTTFVFQSVPTIISNSAEFSPATEYYPANNPSGFLTGIDLSPYETRSETQSFIYPVPSGATELFVPFTPAFSRVPVVAYSLDIPASGYLYALGTSGVNYSGVGVYFSAPVNVSGYTLSIIAKIN